MSSATLDVVGIGNAIVDVIAHADDRFLAAENLSKGAMTLIDAERAQALYAKMGPAVESSGGSVANTMAGIASLGGAGYRGGGYIGKVRDDMLGQVFRHDITATGIRFDTPPAADGPGTARCLILVTPDGQRTMNTFLGACVHFSGADVDAAAVARAQVVYLEGYLFDPPALGLLRAVPGRQHAAARVPAEGVALALSVTLAMRRSIRRIACRGGA
jgi:sugar/nucleoside kinase (ribokinase family)